MTRIILCALALVFGILTSQTVLAATDRGNGPKECGTIKWYNNEKGFGFITDKDGANVFLHYSEILKDSRGNYLQFPEEGGFVTFERIENKQGTKAIKIEVINMKSKKAIAACLDLNEQ